MSFCRNSIPFGPISYEAVVTQACATSTVEMVKERPMYSVGCSGRSTGTRTTHSPQVLCSELISLGESNFVRVCCNRNFLNVSNLWA